MKIVKKINCAGTNLNIYDVPVGVMISGGADSAILLYFVFATILSIALVIEAVSLFKAAVSDVDKSELFVFNAPSSANLWLSEEISSKEVCATIKADKALSRFKLAD